MITPLEAITLYAPVIQFFILYFYAYRHEPLRIFRPKRERTGLRAWVEVLSELGLVDKKELLSITEGSGTARFLTTLLAPAVIISALLSLLELLMVAGSVIARFPLPVLFLLQFIPALLALVVLERRIGPRPLPPYSTIIPDSHGSSLVRHFGKKGRETDER